MAIPEEFRNKWALFNNRAKVEEVTTAELLKDLIEDYLEEFGDELEAPDSNVKEANTPKKRIIKKALPAKKKAFVSKKVSITIKRDDSSDDEDAGIQDTPKFKLLELMRSLDSGNGVDPDELRSAAQDKGITNPRLQLNKMMRRGILYAHEGRVHVA
ncbi:MAG: hypothetical protein BET99_04815 [Marine Group III euryarchaeote CG-Epi2]|uniref:Uncharacterized protein n=1 Tax=Marine Group III euryarchaeote CG-Epi2 TaxID=1888996 RepID=A0A1J5TMT7_9ARCH|nr:MAG: hypothetical protein BET99_04815 [Marine Group III euryarchaeote CG-Epi2]